MKIPIFISFVLIAYAAVVNPTISFKATPNTCGICTLEITISKADVTPSFVFAKPDEFLFVKCD